MPFYVNFKNKSALPNNDSGHLSLWQYEIILDQPVTDGEIGLGFSARVTIDAPSDYPTLAALQDIHLTKNSGIQFVSKQVTLAENGILEIAFIASSLEDSFTAVMLVTMNAEHGTPQMLPFRIESNGVENVTQVLRGPAAIVEATGSTPDPIDALAGKLPYASEPFGVYQPLIGWRSSLQHERLSRATAKRFSNATHLIEESVTYQRAKVIGTLVTRKFEDRTGTQIGRDLAAAMSKRNGDGSSADGWHVLLNGEHDDALLSMTRKIVSGLQNSASQAAQTNEQQSSPSNSLHTQTMSLTNLDLRQNDAMQALVTQINREAATATLFQYLGKNAPTVLSQMFRVSPASWERAVAGAKWFVDDHPAKLAFLSPIGLLHRFREYFFELGTFLGPPVGHVWLSPGGTVELIEVNTRRTSVESIAEQSTEKIDKSELSQTNQDELSDAVKIENAHDTKLGVTASASGGVASIFQASGSASFNLDVSRKQAQEQTHKQMREQSSKLSSEVRQNYKTTFRTLTETTDTSSRRYVLQNTSNKLVSYELSRKMRKVAVQVQDLGQQLCWQLYVDRPGDPLGIGEFVHATAAAADPGVKPPDNKPYPPNIEKTYQLAVPFILYQGADSDAENTYTTYKDHDRGVFVPDVGKDDIIQFKHTFSLPLAPPGYQLQKISALDFHGAQVKFVIDNADLLPNPNPTTNSISLRLTYANFGGAKQLPFDAVVAYEPTQQVKSDVDKINAMSTAAYNDEVELKKEQLFYDVLRKRLKLVGKVRQRPPEDLREEERNVIYRRIIGRLYGSESGWTNEDYHVASELIRYLFDIDAMLYFVAPDWWRPRVQPLVSKNERGELQPTIVAEPAVSDKVLKLGSFGTVTIEGHRPYYMITEETEPAPKGASLGWLIQLDGDAHRNAFLNSPWVKAVLPIRPGRERDAIAWLQRPEVAGTDGLSEPYSFDPEQDPPDYKGLTIEQVLLKIADKIADEHESSKKPVQVDNNPINPQFALPTETVFSHGFDPLEGGISFGNKPFKVFSQWIEVLPTDQVVATEYNLKGN